MPSRLVMLVVVVVMVVVVVVVSCTPSPPLVWDLRGLGMCCH